MVTSAPGGGDERGQAALLFLCVLAALLAGTLVLFGFGQALGTRGKHQRAADLAAVSAAQVMRDNYARLFEPPFLRTGVPNPRHLSTAAYLELARAAAQRGARRNGLPSARLAGLAAGGGGAAQLEAPSARGRRAARVDVSFPGGGFAPTRVAVAIRGGGDVRVAAGRRPDRIDVEARATAELVPDDDLGLSGLADGGGYDGPLAYRQGKPMRPDVALAFDRMAAAAQREAGLYLSITSAFRSDAEQAVLWAANPDPKWVAPPGTSLHRYGTELDLGPPSAYAWLAANSERFGFIKRYEWEPWHFGYARNTGSASVGYGGGAGDGGRAVPSFVPARFHDAIVRAAQRWNVGAALLSAQIYAESNFNPFAQSPAGAQGIAQFMPGTAQSMGLEDPFDPEQAIDAQAHLMRDLLRRFGSVPLALAAYNAGAGAVEQYGGIPPFAETRAYVAKILGLLGGAGDLSGAPSFEVRLVE
jgi:transglycosylase-like protein with SLT domain/D-alanyl-D-alanine carboxypeptidase-like protein/putative Flp pilus-assembly TadE/G-like protein